MIIGRQSQVCRVDSDCIVQRSTDESIVFSQTTSSAVLQSQGAETIEISAYSGILAIRICCATQYQGLSHSTDGYTSRCNEVSATREKCPSVIDFTATHCDWFGSNADNVIEGGADKSIVACQSPATTIIQL